ncbi:ogr/Delta-like zinc finger family protein [Candidatus Pacearchaeota archaeon]|nr:ogr/Delta-like zinc finger family protein [Candidatus Pacearchaeota archaeon]
MKCPKCGRKTAVIDSRDGKITPNSKNRKRKCVNPKCSYKFVTIEIHKSVFDDLNPRDNRYTKLITKIREVLSADIKKHNKGSD